MFSQHKISVSRMVGGHVPKRHWLEAMKFSLYIATPITATLLLGSGAYSYLEKIIEEVRLYLSFRLNLIFGTNS